MKKNLLFLVFSVFVVTGYSQKLAKTLTKKPVTSVNWGNQSVRFADGFLEMVEIELKKLFTQPIVDSIIRHSMSMYFPNGFKDTPKDKVKMYHVATFNNNFGGQFRGIKYIVMVPYEENKELWKNTRSRPNDFFLLFNKEAVVLEN